MAHTTSHLFSIKYTRYMYNIKYTLSTEVRGAACINSLSSVIMYAVCVCAMRVHQG